MSVENLAIVFGPTLFSQSHQTEGNAALNLPKQISAVKIVLEHYTDIFVEGPEHA